MRKMALLTTVAVMVVSVAAGLCLAADEKAATTPAKRVAVLDTYSVWRIYQTLKPPVIDSADGPKPVVTPLDWLNRETAEPPAGWTNPGFDDSTWLRGSARAFARTSYLSRLCLRGQFEVTDPAKVEGLVLRLSYYGGAIVYVNGKEVARGHLARRGKVALAEGYPVEAFVTKDGKIVPSGWVVERYKKALAARKRTLAEVAIPAKLLRKGVNVLAIEIVRAPYHKIIGEKKVPLVDPGTRINRGVPYHLSWNTCEMRKVRLEAGDVGLVPNASRPKGLQAWNSDFLTSDYAADFGDRCQVLRPVTLKGVRNGWFSGKVVLGSPKAIEGLKATCGDLTQGGSTIPASAVRVRYGFPWGRTSFYGDANPRGAAVLDGLLEKPLDVFPAGKYGATVPIWVTVKVPAKAGAGVYTGQLKVTVKGQAPLKVPLRLEVADWTLPDTQDWRAWVELIQSPDTLAAEYGVPLWSDEHFKMIGQSMRYIGEIGSRVVYVPLICQTNFGNEQSMVRWIKKSDGTIQYDFSVMDRYLDLAEKNMGRPKLVVFTAWEVYLRAPDKEVIINEKDSSYVRMEKSWKAARWDLRGKGPAVTVLDPASGKTSTVRLPRFDDPKAKALWGPLFTELHKRMKKRGLESTMTLGMASDTWPSKEELAMLQEVSGGLPWVMHTHGGSRVRQKMYGLAPLRYIAYVWDVKYADPSKGSLYGWKRPELQVQFLRFRALNVWPPSSLMHFEELNITGAQRGVGRIGADFWATIKNKRGRRTGHVWGRYLQSLWHSLNLSSHMLVPGPNGPVATTRYEYFREGVQQCEARIAIERALTDQKLKAKLGPQLVARCQEVLDQRLRDIWRSGSNLQLTTRYYASAKNNHSSYGGVAGHLWYIGSGWQDRTQQLYALAGQVARKLAAN